MKIPWNFTKFLVDKDGQVVNFYGPDVDPQKILPDIFKLLEINPKEGHQSSNLNK